MIADNSMLSSYSRCQWLYGLQYELHRQPLEPRLAIEVGVLTHDTWNCYLTTDRYAVKRKIEDSLEQLRSLPISDAERIVASTKYSAAVAELLAAYPLIEDANGTRIITSTDGLPRWIVRYPEAPFCIPLNEAHSFMGRIDVIVEDGNSQLWILELKTSGFANQPTWRTMFKLSTQPRGYVWVATVTLSKTVAGAIIIPVWLSTRQEKGQKYGVAKLMEEIPLRYTASQLAQWQQQTIKLMDEIPSSQLLPTGMYSGGCSSAAYGICSFFDYCNSNYSEGLLASQTQEKVWSPLN